MLSCRAFVVLENEHQDLEFVLTCVDTVEHGPKLNKFYNKMWIARGAGGCGEIPKLISKCYDEQSRVPRILVINDSDKYHKDYTVSIAQENISNRAKEKRSEHVMLRKREIENYIPNFVLDEIYSPQYPKLKYIKQWNNEQRDYFDMKKGFPKTCRHDDDKYNNIYNDILDSHRDEFKGSGFGEDISKTAFNDEHRKLYTRKKLDLEDSTIYAEFSEIKDKLLSIL